MRLLIALIFVVFTINANALYCEKSGNSADNTGAVISGLDDKCWTIVKNTLGSALANGDVVCLDVTATGDNGASVTSCTVEGGPGHCVAMEAIADDAYGKCQVWGKHDSIKFDASIGATAGEFMYMGSAALSVEPLVKSAATDDIPIGIFYDSSVASGSIQGFLRML